MRGHQHQSKHVKPHCGISFVSAALTTTSTIAIFTGLAAALLASACTDIASREAAPFYTPPEPTLHSQYLSPVKSVLVIHNDDEPSDCAIVLSQTERDSFLAWRASSEEDTIWGDAEPDTSADSAELPRAPAPTLPTPSLPTNLPPKPGG